MRVTALAVLALAFFPAAASALVQVNVGRVDVVPNRADQIVSFEVFATNADASENERLNAFTIALEASNFSPTGIRFVVPPVDPGSGTIPFDVPTENPYVFGAYPGNGPVDPTGQSDYNTVFLSAALGGTGQEANISDALNGFAKVSVLIPASAPFGFYAINLDPNFLSLGSAGAPITAVAAPGVFLWPEPGVLGLLGVAGIFALRRRRAA